MLHPDTTGDLPADTHHLTVPLPPEDPLEGVEPTDEPVHWRQGLEQPFPVPEDDP